MYISQIIKDRVGEIEAIDPEQTLVVASVQLAKKNIGMLMVINSDNKVVGVLSGRDIVRAIADMDSKALSVPVKAVMSRNIISCSPDETIVHAMKLMSENNIRHLPVMSQEDLLGVVSIKDVVKHRLAEVEFEFNSLKGYMCNRVEPRNLEPQEPTT